MRTRAEGFSHATARLAASRGRCIGVLILGLLTCPSGPAIARGPDDGIAFFETKIRPVLIEKCYSCHSERAEKLKGGLKLDTRAGIRQGGDSGPAVVPGKPDESTLLQAIAHTDAFSKMPPKEKLPDARHRRLPPLGRDGRARPARGLREGRGADRIGAKVRLVVAPAGRESPGAGARRPTRPPGHERRSTPSSSRD